MKMSVFDRMLLLLLILFTVAVSVLLFCVSLRVVPEEAIQSVVGLLYYDLTNALIAGGIALVLLLIALRLLFRGRSQTGKNTLVNSGEAGSIHISNAALDAMVQRHVRSNTQVRDCKSFIVTKDGGVGIRLVLTLLPDTNIPETVGSVQTSLREYVEGLSGVHVHGVDITVESTPPDNRSRYDKAG